MKLLCDEMLKGLARWLRTSGYDVAMEPDGRPDRQLVARALAEGRVLLTRDRFLLQIRDAMRVTVLLEGNGVESCAREITRKLDIDWLLNPFTRCSLCNSPLIEAEPSPQWPPDIHKAYRCPCCNKFYWQGGHVERMRQKLECWQTEFR
ncbi:MAG: DUF5615 family PIN-like protein [Methylophilaceae bacterium]|jgi:uncharacterized protein with PIN domain